MKASQLTSNLYVLNGAVNTGVVVSGRKAILIDCCDTVTPERLAELGVEHVEMILCTQHRRPNTAGAYPFIQAGATLIAPADERHLFEDPSACWNNPVNRWHIYHFQPGPLVPARPLPVERAVREGDTIEWEGTTIRVLDTPGATTGSVSYLIETGGKTICFSGDAVYGPGQVWDFHSLQDGVEGYCTGYHGFLTNTKLLLPSLEKLSACRAEVLVPSHGEPIHDPCTAIALLAERLDVILRNYVAITCLNHYMPGLYADRKNDVWRMKPATTHEPPDFVQAHSFTSFLLVSDTGAALMIDCGSPSVVQEYKRLIEDGRIKSIEGCWITHYHDDHVDALRPPGGVPDTFRCPIMTVEHVAEIVEHPMRFFLPCISPNAAPVDRKVRDGESWQWHEFKLTAFHLPGQSYYHSGLLVEGHGKKLLFSGDSGSPTGLDDHCCANRNFLGAGNGFRRVIEIWRRCKPDYIFNQHQPLAFSFTDEQLDYMDKMLAERERLFAEVLPWAHPNFGTDEHWVRSYPYEQEVGAGATFSIDVQFTNHGLEPVAAKAEPVLPEGWTWDAERSAASVDVPANTDGSVDAYCANPDKSARLWVSVPDNAVAGRHVIALRITWGGRYLGQFRHAIVTCR